MITFKTQSGSAYQLATDGTMCRVPKAEGYVFHHEDDHQPVKLTGFGVLPDLRLVLATERGAKLLTTPVVEVSFTGDNLAPLLTNLPAIEAA